MPRPKKAKRVVRKTAAKRGRKITKKVNPAQARLKSMSDKWRAAVKKAQEVKKELTAKMADMKQSQAADLQAATASAYEKGVNDASNEFAKREVAKEKAISAAKAKFEKKFAKASKKKATKKGRKAKVKTAAKPAAKKATRKTKAKRKVTAKRKVASRKPAASKTTKRRGRPAKR